MWETALFIIGLIVGLFVWATLIGSLFASIPVRRRLIKQGIIKDIHMGQIVASVIIALTIIVSSVIYVPLAFYGSLIAAVVMLFNIGKLQQEELEKYIKGK